MEPISSVPLGWCWPHLQYNSRLLSFLGQYRISSVHIFYLIFLIQSYLHECIKIQKVQPGRGAEETAIIGGGGEGFHQQGFQRLWAPPGDGDILQIPGTVDICGRRQLDGGGE